MNKEQRDAMRSLAEEATPGPWNTEPGWKTISSEAVTDIAILNMANMRHGWGGSDYSSEKHRQANAAHIAAANPSAILQLLDYIETLEKDASRYLWCKLHPERAASIFEHLGPAYFDSEIDAAMQGETE